MHKGKGKNALAMLLHNSTVLAKPKIIENIIIIKIRKIIKILPSKLIT
jgi:hypothetical protein